MSVILSNLIRAELQQLQPSPQLTKQQQEFADAIARAVQAYLNNPAAVVGVSATGPVTLRAN